MIKQALAVWAIGNFIFLSVKCADLLMICFETSSSRLALFWQGYSYIIRNCKLDIMLLDAA